MLCYRTIMLYIYIYMYIHTYILVLIPPRALGTGARTRHSPLGQFSCARTATARSEGLEPPAKNVRTARVVGPERRQTRGRARDCLGGVHSRQN